MKKKTKLQIDILISNEKYLKNQLNNGEISKDEYNKKFNNLLEQYKKLRGEVGE